MKTQKPTNEQVADLASRLALEAQALDIWKNRSRLLTEAVETLLDLISEERKPVDVTVYSTAGRGSLTFYGVIGYRLVPQGSTQNLILQYPRGDRDHYRHINVLPGDVIYEGTLDNPPPGELLEELVEELWGPLEVGPH